MPITRRIARPLIAGMFISGGIDALLHPDAKAPRAQAVTEPITDTLGITRTRPRSCDQRCGHGRRRRAARNGAGAAARRDRARGLRSSRRRSPGTASGRSTIRPSVAAAHPLPQERVDARRADPRRDRHRRPPVIVVAREEAGAPGPSTPCRPATDPSRIGRAGRHALDCGRDHVHLRRLARHRTARHLHRSHRPGVPRPGAAPAPRRHARRRDADRQRAVARAVLAGRRGRSADRRSPARQRHARSTSCTAAGGIRKRASATRTPTVSSAEVIYPSVGMLLCNHPDVDYQHACFEAYNRWIAEFCSYAPDATDRHRPDRAAHAGGGHPRPRGDQGLGLRGVMLPGVPPNADYDDPMYDEFWDAVVDIGLPPSFHILTIGHRHAVRAEHPRPEAEQLHVDPPRQPGHHRHARCSAPCSNGIPTCASCASRPTPVGRRTRCTAPTTRTTGTATG